MTTEDWAWVLAVSLVSLAGFVWCAWYELICPRAKVQRLPRGMLVPDGDAGSKDGEPPIKETRNV